MASDYQKLVAKRKKYIEQGGNDPKVLYAFDQQMPYANSVDIDAIREAQKVIDKL